MEKKEKLVAAGKVASPHGVKGQVKIYSYLEYPEKFSEYRKFYFSNGEEVKIKYHHSNKNFAIVSINGISVREEVQKLNNKEIYIKKSQFKKLDENEYYQIDLIGSKVLLASNNSEFGEVVEVYNFGFNDLLEIENNGKKQMYIFNNENFPKVDIANKLIHINPPEIENS